MGSCGAGRAVGWEPPRCGAELSEKLLLPYASPELSWLRSLEGCAWKKCPACGRPHAAWLGVARSACLAARRKYVWFCPEWGRAPQAPGKHSLEAGGWVPGEQLWVFFFLEDRLQLRFPGRKALFRAVSESRRMRREQLRAGKPVLSLVCWLHRGLSP